MVWEFWYPSYFLTDQSDSTIFGYDVEDLTYQPFGGAKAMNTGGGGTVGAGFDDAGRMVVSNPGATHERTFTYDNNGNLTSVNAPSTPDFSRSYIYDQLNRLIHAEGPWGDIDYTYDDVGNRLTKVENDVTNTYTYVTGTNILDTVTNGGSTAYANDANGNITGIGDKVLTCNQDNRLVNVEEKSITLGEYTYNGLGQRILKTVEGTTTVFHYDFDGNIIGESNISGAFSKEYIYYGSSRLAMADVATEEIYFYGNDRLGTPQILTDSTNKVVWEANYKPFGEAEVHPNSSVENNFRFPGQYYDSETGLHYNYHRYYDPQTGRYLTPDPIGLFFKNVVAYEINYLYLYVLNNPVNNSDNFGLLHIEYQSPTTPAWDVPPGDPCKAYGNNTILRNICNAAGTGCWSNCVRGCLLADWDECSGSYSSGLISRHVDCWHYCTIKCHGGIIVCSGPGPCPSYPAP